MDLSGADSRNISMLMGWAVLIMWLKVFYFGRIFKSTAALIRMVIEITFDMKYFLVIFVISVAGFAN